MTGEHYTVSFLWSPPATWSYICRYFCTIKWPDFCHLVLTTKRNSTNLSVLVSSLSNGKDKINPKGSFECLHEFKQNPCANLHMETVNRKYYVKPYDATILVGQILHVSLSEDLSALLLLGICMFLPLNCELHGSKDLSHFPHSAWCRHGRWEVFTCIYWMNGHW